MARGARTLQTDFRVVQPSGSVRWCTGTAAASFDAADRLVRVSGVTIDVTERKEAEERQDLVGARSRSPRPQRARSGAVDRAADTGQQRRGLRRRGRGPHQSAGARACASVRCALAQRRPGCSGGGRIGAVSGGRSRQGPSHRAERLVAAAYGAGLGAGAARTRHQRRQARRVVVPARKAQPELAIAAGLSRRGMDRNRRAPRGAAFSAQLRPEGDPHQHRKPAQRQSDLRMGAAGHAMHVGDPARQ